MEMISGCEDYDDFMAIREVACSFKLHNDQSQFSSASKVFPPIRVLRNFGHGEFVTIAKEIS